MSAGDHTIKCFSTAGSGAKSLLCINTVRSTGWFERDHMGKHSTKDQRLIKINPIYLLWNMMVKYNYCG
jgi:hypothetical protein